MPTALADLVAPGHTALVLQECQHGILGAESALPVLAEANPQLIPNLGRLARAATAPACPSSTRWPTTGPTGSAATATPASSRAWPSRR